MVILGISAYYHDSAAVLIKEGKIVSAIEEERFSRIKHDNSFPYKAIDYCLRSQGLDIEGVDYIAYYEKPLLKFERILETFLDTYPFAVGPFLKGIPEWLDYKIKVESTIRKLGYKSKIFFVPHHLSHASATFLSSPFEESAILTVDGVGEWQTTGMWKGKGNHIDPLVKIDFPNSLGLFYSTFTAHMGFKVNEDEYKLMGLAAYGKPLYANRVRKIIDVKNDGSFALDFRYFSFRESFSMYNRKFEELFGKARNKGEKITKYHADLAASVQAVTEDLYFKMLNHLHNITGSKNLCISGGVALNALANGKIYEKTPFKEVFIFGAAGDSGAAFGAAQYANSVILNNERIRTNNLYFGSQYDDDYVKNVLVRYGLKYRRHTTQNSLIDKAASLLAKGKIVGWFQGRCEYGPRALGNRSILCKPNPRSMKAKMNVIKRREQFRPFAGSIIQDQVDKYFDVPKRKQWSPFMTFCFNVKKEKRDLLKAIVHNDGTCRIQTVSKKNGRYYYLIKKFQELTGISCVMNTSFNLMGEPIVETPEQAIDDYLKTKMDRLFVGNFEIYK